MRRGAKSENIPRIARIGCSGGRWGPFIRSVSGCWREPPAFGQMPRTHRRVWPTVCCQIQVMDDTEDSIAHIFGFLRDSKSTGTTAGTFRPGLQAPNARSCCADPRAGNVQRASRPGSRSILRVELQPDGSPGRLRRVASPPPSSAGSRPARGRSPVIFVCKEARFASILR